MKNIIETYSVTANGVEICVQVDYREKKISVLDLATLQPKKFVFAERGLEYTQGWKNVLNAIGAAVDSAEGKLKSERQKEIGTFVQGIIGDCSYEPNVKEKTLNGVLFKWLSLYERMGMKWQDFKYATKSLEGKELTKDGHMLVIELAAVSTERIIEELRKVTDVWAYAEDFSKVTDHNFPGGKDHFAFVESGKEPSEKYANESWNDLKEEGATVCSLRQRLLMELFERVTKDAPKDECVFDYNNWTLTSSVDASGDAVRVDWIPGSREVGVYWYDPSDADGYLRARSAVSL